MSKAKPTSARGVTAVLKSGAVGLHGAGNGLYLKVTGTGSGSWVFRYKVAGKTRMLGLGVVDAVTLAEARNEVLKNKALIAQGIDPLEDKRSNTQQEAAKAITFEQVAEEYMKAQEPSWTNAKHIEQWHRTLEMFAYPVIGDLVPADITTEHVLKILQPIWNTKKETASRVRNRIELVLNAAKARKLREGENVAAWRGHLELLLAKHKGSDVKHHSALPWSEVAAFIEHLNQKNDTSSQALQLVILTGLRTGEVLGANWSEFDLVNKVWTIPPERMKARKEHRVPLSSAVLKLLQEIPRVESGLLFEGQKVGKQVSNMALLMKIRRLDEQRKATKGKGWRDSNGDRITTHGFRSTFRDWAAECTPFENIVVEQALAHTIGNAVEAAYRRGDLLERRRELMETWAQYVTQPSSSNVMPFRKEA